MFSDLIIDIIKSGTTAIVMSKISKSIGQCDISEIISGAGWTIVGVDCIKLTIPFCRGIKVISNNINDFFTKIGEIFDKIDVFDLF